MHPPRHWPRPSSDDANAAARTRPRPRIDPQRCTGCGRCVAVCTPHVLWLQPQGWDKVCELHDEPGCTGCSLCEPVCPFGAITMTRSSRA